MNIIKKVYCRIFQFCFKMAIPILPYYNPTILNSVEDIPSILRNKKITKILLVTDKSIKELESLEKTVNNAEHKLLESEN